MSPQQVIDFFGGKTKAAAGLGKTETCIITWDKAKSIPLWSQHAICNITKGALKVDRVKK